MNATPILKNQNQTVSFSEPATVLENTTPILETKNLTMRFGGLTAVNNINLCIQSEDLVGLIGPNGAGKTTLFNMVTGIYHPSEGEIKLEGNNIIGIPSAKITQKGMARTFQNIRLFKDLSVIDNIRLAGHSKVKYGLLSSIFRTKKFKAEEEKLYQKSIELLKIFDLDQKKDIISSNLPYGEQRRLEMCRALATEPKILLLDEPAAGMNPCETKELTKLIKWVRNKFKIAILLIEHDMNLVMDVCEKIYVVDHGELVTQGTPHQVQNDPKVIEAYLGKQD